MGLCCSTPNYRVNRVVERHRLKFHSISTSPIWTMAASKAFPGHILTGDDDGAISLFDYHSHKLRCAFSSSQPWLRLSTPSSNISNDRHYFAGAGRDCSPSVYTFDDNLTTITHLHSFEPHTAAIYGLCSSSDFSWIASGSRDYSVRIHDTLHQTTLCQTSPSRNVVTDMCLFDGNSNNPLIIQSAENLSINCWNTNLEKVFSVSLNDHFATSVCSVSCTSFASLHNGFDGGGGHLYVWDTRSLDEPYRVLEGHGERGNCVMSTSATELFSVGSDCQLKYWVFDDLFEGCKSSVSLPSIGLSLTSFDSKEGKVICVGCAQGEMLFFVVLNDTIVETMRSGDVEL
ncbi:hypothetical protein P9112_002148 [Eukaryota sp. TZLM1-RC]